MYDNITPEQYYILHQLENWYDHRVCQNIFIEYRSWSNLFQTLSKYTNQSNISNREILFLTPVQIHAVELSRSGLWAESIREYIYTSHSIDAEFITDMDISTWSAEELNNMHRIRDEMLYRYESQPRPKLVIIVDAELINAKMLKDCNEYLHMQTVVCFDSARYHPDDSIANKVKGAIKHIFLHEDAPEAQQFLYRCMEKRMIPLSKDPDVRVFEYTRAGYDLTKLPTPLISCAPDYHPPMMNDPKVVKGSLIYSTNYRWSWSLENNRYYLIKGIYMYIDTMSKRLGKIRVSAHPTYTKYKFKTVTGITFRKVTTPCLIDDMPAWKFSKGGIIVPKILRDINDARRVYNAVNMFWDRVNFFIV